MEGMRFTTTLVVCAGLLLARPALAGPPTADEAAPPSPPKDIRDEVPLIGYTVSAFGASARTAGAAGYAGVLTGAAVPAASGASSTQATGGARIWGSPVDRLTIMLAVDRRYYDKAAPSATAIVRIFGDRDRGWALGLMATYRTDGFAELGGEIEGGLDFSVARSRFRADANLVVGGEPDGGDADGELRLRLGYDATRWLRIGADGQFRYKLAGAALLPGGRVADAVVAPELLFGVWHFFIAARGGPTTVGVGKGIGWTATTTLGGAYF
jgi:hypothetical protein